MTDNPVRGRFNAWLLDELDDYMHRKYGALKTRLFRDTPPTVIELGAGSGANFRYYPRGTRVVAIEPNVRMHARLQRAAERHGLTLELHHEGGETLPLATGSAEFVCSTLVMCSVGDPTRVAREVRRVLAPSGRFVCIEHVIAPPGSAVAKLQRAIRRPWQWIFEGCDLCNQTEAVMREAGFRDIEVEPLWVDTIFLPIRYQVVITGVG